MISKFIKRNENAKIASIYLAANILNKAIAFVTIPFFTRLMSTSEYGIVSTYCSVVMILQYFIGLSSEYTIRNAFVDFKDDIEGYMFSILSLSAVCASSIGIGVLVIGLYMQERIPIFLVVCCIIQSYCTFVVNASAYKYMMEKDYMRRSIMLAGPNLISAILGLIFLIMIKGYSVEARVCGYVFSFLLFGGYCIFKIVCDAKAFNAKKYWRYVIKLSPPLVVHGLSVIALSQIDRIMISSLKSTDETGIYSIVYSLSMIALAVTQAMQGIWTPWFTEKYEEKEYEQIEKKAKDYLFIVGVMIAFIMLSSPEILMLMAPKNYWGGIKLIPPLVMSSFFIYGYSFFVGLELHEKHTKLISVCTVISAVVNIGLNFLFIPLFGAVAAAYTTLIAYILLFLLHWYCSRYLNRKIFFAKTIFITWICPSLSMGLTYLFSDETIIRWGLACIYATIAGVIIKKNRILQ